MLTRPGCDGIFDTHTLKYVEELKRGPNTAVGPKDFFEMASIKGHGKKGGGCMKKLSMILTVLIIFGTSAIGQTSDKCVVFDGTFAMSTRRPVAHFEYFQALDGEAIVKVYNEAGGHHAKKVKSATVSINGKKVISHRDFYKKRFFHFWNFTKKAFFRCSYVQRPDAFIEKTVALTKGQNSLEVMLNSRRGGKIRVVVMGQKFLEPDDDGDGILMSYETPCTGGSTALCNDNCPDDFNPDQADSDGDGIGDVYPNMVMDTIPVGTELYSRPYGGIAVLSHDGEDGEFVYVSNYGDNTVNVINTLDNSVRDIPVGAYPIGIGVSKTSKGEFVYVSSYTTDSVWVIETEGNTVIGDPIPVVDGPFGLAVTPDGAFVYVCNYLDNSVSVIETEGNTVIGDPIPVGDHPIGASVTPDGLYVYVCNYFGNTVSVIETEGNTVIGDPIPVGKYPFGVSVTPDSNFAYVSNYYDDSVSVIETEGNTVVGDPIQVGGGPFGIAVTPNGAYAYVNNYYDDSVSVIRTKDNTLIDTDTSTDEIDPILLGEGDEVKRPYGGIAVSPSGEFVYVGNYGDGTVSVIGIYDETTP